jgi:hypothetical protein
MTTAPLPPPQSEPARDPLTKAWERMDQGSMDRLHGSVGAGQAAGPTRLGDAIKEALNQRLLTSNKTGA